MDSSCYPLFLGIFLDGLQGRHKYILQEAKIGRKQ